MNDGELSRYRSKELLVLKIMGKQPIAVYDVGQFLGDGMRWLNSLSSRLFALGAALLLLALTSIGVTLWITHQLDGGAAAVNEAGRLRMQAWRLTSLWQAQTPPVEIGQRVEAFDRSIALLRDGDDSRPLFVPWDDGIEARFTDLSQAWRKLDRIWQTDPAASLSEATAQVNLFVSVIDELVHAIEKKLTHYTALLNLFQFFMMAVAVAAALMAMYVGYLFVIQPLRKLTLAMQRVDEGDFFTQVQVAGPREFVELSEGFNHMTQTLQQLYGHLERKVAEKTRDLEAKQVRLQSLYDMATFLVEPNAVEELAMGFAQKVRQISGAAAAAVRWTDAANARYMMLASDALPEELVNEERCLEPGVCACGQPQATARSRVIPIIAEDDRLLGNCAKAGYKSLISVPIRLNRQVMGEVDLFFHEAPAFSDEDQALYDALAGHLASAVESLRASALLREAAVSEERSMLARELHDSIAQSLAFLKIQVSLLRQAVLQRESDRINEIISEIDVGVKESTNDVRELLVHFRTRTNSEDIEQAIEVTLSKFEHQSGIRTRLNVTGHGVPLHSDTQLQLLHVIQEALSNVRKHAKATEVSLVIQKGTPWRFKVHDNGVGFSQKKAQDTDTHVGLQIMNERAERIGAKVQIESESGVGSTVTIELNE